MKTVSRISAAVLVFVTALTLVFATCDIARADILYITDNGKLGRITIPSITSVDVKTLTTDTGLINKNTGVFSFQQFGKGYVILTNPGAGANGDDQARVYNLDSDWTKQQTVTPVTLKDIRGACALAEAGNQPSSAIYIAGKNGKVVEFENQNNWTKRNSCVVSEDNVVGTGVDVLLHEGWVISLFGRSRKSDGTLLNGKIIRERGQLDASPSQDDRISADVGINPSGIAVTSTFHMAVAYRGDSSKNIHGGVDMYTGDEVTSLISDIVGSVEAIARDGDEGFYFIELIKNSNGTDNTAKLYRWKKGSANNTRSEIRSWSSVGDNVQLVWDDTSEVLAVLLSKGNGTSGEIVLLNNKNQVQNVTGLGGNPISITTAVKSGNSDNDDSDGCNIGITGLSGLAVLALVMSMTRKRA